MNPDSIVDDPDYLRSIFEHIQRKWPELYRHVIIDHYTNPNLAIRTTNARTRLQDVIGYHDYNHFDGIIRHIMKNEDKIVWWIL